jgi:hypothetical protein
MVQVYSNCDTAELFLNGKSCGVKKRNGQDFPAAGLRWIVPFQAGENHLCVVAKNRVRRKLRTKSASAIRPRNGQTGEGRAGGAGNAY